MSATSLTQFLIDVTRGHRSGDFAKDPDGVLKSSGLADDLCKAIREQKVDALWLAGAHPMALLYFARECGWSGDRYYECIGAARRGSQIS